MIINKAELLLLRIPIKTPFTVSFGTIDFREFILVKLYTKDLVGYGECAAFHLPFYLPDFTYSEWWVMENMILPSLLNRDFHTAEELVATFEVIKGHNFAKAAVESAFWHLLAQQENKSLKQLFGGSKNKIPVGESLGIKSSIEETLNEVQQRLDEGYKRIKLKIKKGWDFELAKAVRAQFPDISLMLDANSDYTIDDIKLFQSFEDLNLLMIEQPFEYNDLVDHAVLQKSINTPVCLDESILSLKDTKKALSIDSCRTINIKPGRVGGPLETIAIHDYCAARNIPVWCGGLLESGIGRAFNIALASLENFVHPADMSETNLFFQEDLVSNPYEIKNGEITVPDTPGLGFEIYESRVAKYTLQKAAIQ